MGAACWFPSASARRSCPTSSRLAIPLVGREGELPIAMAWPVAGGRDGRQATETAHGIALRGCPPQLRDLLPGAGAYWACATLPTGLCLACWMRGSTIFFLRYWGVPWPLLAPSLCRCPQEKQRFSTRRFRRILRPVWFAITTTTHDFREKNLTCMEY